MGDMTRCPRCAMYHYRNDPCPFDDEPEDEPIRERDFHDRADELYQRWKEGDL